MIGVGRIRFERRNAELLQHAERHAGRDALTVRGNLVQTRIATGGRDRTAPVELVVRQIVERHGGAALLRKRRDAFGQFAAIEGFAIRLGDLLQRARHALLREHFADARRAAVRQETLGETRLFAQRLCGLGPLGADDRRDVIAARRIADGGFEQAREGQLAETA